MAPAATATTRSEGECRSQVSAAAPPERSERNSTAEARERERKRARARGVEETAQQPQQGRDHERHIAERGGEIGTLERDTPLILDIDRPWHERILIGGLIEVEAGFNSPYEGDAQTDLYAAAIELGVSAAVHSWVTADLLLVYEQDGFSDEDSDVFVDVGSVSIADPDGSWGVVAGRQYVPFGTYLTDMVSDPMTLELGETNEVAALFTYEAGGLGGSVYAFKGDNPMGDDSEIDNFGFQAGYSGRGTSCTYAATISFINDIGESDTIQEHLADADDDGTHDSPSGVALDAVIEMGSVVLIGDFVAATDEFDTSRLAFAGGGAKPKAWNIEAGYLFSMWGRKSVAAVAYQGTDEAVGLELPAERIRVGLSSEILDNTALSFEWSFDKDYDTDEGGTGQNGNVAILQLAVGF